MANPIEFNGLLLIDKPAGITSFGVISRLRSITGFKKIGHCGTLDPFATGLLPVLFGRYTKLAKYIETADKTYLTKFVLGVATDTMDITGQVVHSVDPEQLAHRIDSGELAQTLQKVVDLELSGEIEQVPPMYSAVKIGGKRLYQYARAGEVIERKSRKVMIYQVELSQIFKENDQWVCEARIKCSKGTYIRTWLDDLGKKAACYAYAKTLHRLECDHLSLEENSYTLDFLSSRFKELKEDPELMRQEIEKNYFYPINKALVDFPSYSLNNSQARKVIHGQPLQLENLISVSSAVLIKLLYNNELLAIVSFDPTKSKFVKYERVLADRI